MGIPKEKLLFSHTMGFDQKLIELDNPHNSQIWETSSHRFPNVWEYLFGNTDIFHTHGSGEIFPV